MKWGGIWGHQWCHRSIHKGEIKTVKSSPLICLVFDGPGKLSGWPKVPQQVGRVTEVRILVHVGMAEQAWMHSMQRLDFPNPYQPCFGLIGMRVLRKCLDFIIRGARILHYRFNNWICVHSPSCALRDSEFTVTAASDSRRRLSASTECVHTGKLVECLILNLNPNDYPAYLRV